MIRAVHAKARGLQSPGLISAFIALLLAPSAVCAEQFFATQTIARTIGGQQQAGFTDPVLALGAPRGGGITTNSLHVYNLGNGGSLTLGFDDGGPSHRYITDGPGPDFIVSENAFYQDDDPHRSFAELMFVEVSSDGTNFQRFLNYSATPDPVVATGVLDPDNLAGFAGVNPVLANAVSNAIDPFEVGAAGGDVFDLRSLTFAPLVQSGLVDLQRIRYVRLVDVIGNGSVADSFGRPIYDPFGLGVGGADVDSVAVVNGAHAPEPGAMVLFVAAIFLVRR